MLMNAAGHGAGFDPEEHIEISYIRAKSAIACRVTDPGSGFKLNKGTKSWLDNPLDSQPERDFLSDAGDGIRNRSYGILLAKQLVDELIYNEQGNEVILIKYLEEMSFPPLSQRPH
jgi:anti-sigma regulatory factor (Ser/Thr protein kinase)